MQEKIRELLNPVAPGEAYYRQWVIGAVEIPPGDEAKVTLLLADGATGREIRLEIMPRDKTKPCYDHSRSFNFAFTSKERETLTLEEERAMTVVIDAVLNSDRGRLTLRKDAEGKTELVETAPTPGFWDRVRGKFRKKQEVKV